MGRCCSKPGKCLSRLGSCVWFEMCMEDLRRAITGQREERKSMIVHTKKHQAKSHTGQDEISIHIAQKHSFEHPLSFEGRVQVILGGHHVVWTMDMLPGMQVLVQLERDQRLILIVSDQDLLTFQPWDAESTFYRGTRRSA